jgi:simple sugar transport system substrate-binding protein
MKIKATIALALGLALVVGACGNTTSTAAPSSAAGDTQASCNYPGDLTGGKALVIYLEGLGDPTSGFFRTLNNGAQQAGKDLCVEVKYVYPQGGFDLATYTQQIEQTIAAQPDGIIILEIGDLSAVTQQAVDKGIAVAFNPAPSVKDQPLRDPNDIVVSRVGADEYAAGAMAAQRFIDDGRKSMICVQQEATDGTQSLRCQGASDTAAAAGIKYDLVIGDPDPGKTAAILTPYLRAHTDVDAMVNTGGSATGGLPEAVKAVGRDIETAGFDVLPEIVALIQAGDLTFTMDQQGWWRGYIAVMQLVHNIRYGLLQANYYLTGPIIVDKSNADDVASLAEAGVR